MAVVVRIKLRPWGWIVKVNYVRFLSLAKLRKIFWIISELCKLFDK